MGDFHLPWAIWVIGGGLLLFQVTVAVLMTIMVRRAKVALAYKPFWKAFQSGVADSLHHPHPESREMDKLLEQLENLTIDAKGTKRLKTLLREKSKDPNEPPDERNRAQFLLFAMPMVVKEREKTAAAVDKSD